MTTYPCPKNGCASTEPDWCSECGAALVLKTAVAAQPTAGAAAAPMLCPNCGTPRTDNRGRFCGVCRYDYETGQSYTPSSLAQSAATETTATPPPVPTAATPPRVEAMAPSPPAAAPSRSWSVIIDFDPTLDPTVAAPTAAEHPRLTFPLDLPELLIGRAGGKAHPEIPVADEGVSSRHAKLLFDPAGELTLLELGSTNGTLINGVAATPGLPTPLKPGDELLIGRWSKLTLVAK